MQNKKFKNIFLLFGVFSLFFSFDAFAQEKSVQKDVEINEVNENLDDKVEALPDWDVEESDYEMVAEDESADAVMNYDMDGSLFQQITDLEQEKVLMQLAKERAQLDLELDRLAAEKIKLHMELDDLSSRKNEQKQLLEDQKKALEAEAAKVEQQKKKVEQSSESSENKQEVQQVVAQKVEIKTAFKNKYKLIDIIGAGKQLQSTVQNLNTGQQRKISVGKILDGYTVKSISLFDGVVFEKDGENQVLNIRASE